jgi:succinyl-diaminopimelate desuccinylase
MLPLKELLAKLISFQSVTPEDAGCQDYMIELLQDIGFTCKRYDNPPVANFFARLGTHAPLLIFAGHTDVVPVGEHTKWQTDPFKLHEQDGILYGRGTADMKGSIASMLIAAARFVKAYPDFSGSLGFLITSGEEGDEFDLGTPYVMEQLHKEGLHPDFCVVGEPSSSKCVGDVIKIGRRGSLTATLELHGKQGHVAYPHLAENPIHKITPALAELTALHWDEGNAHFPPTSMQITNIHSGGQAGNIIPGELKLQFNFRYSTEQTDATLKAAVEECFARHQLKPIIKWRLNGKPFLTSGGQLLESSIAAIEELTDQKPELSTSGGTSDGRFIAPFGIEVIELGPVNATIHQVNECVALADLETLSNIYYLLCEKLLRAPL